MGVIDVFRDLGRDKAKALKARVGEMDGTELIENEYGIAPFDPQRDYLNAPADTPVTDEGQVWTLLIPHNAAHYPGLRPSTNRACWGLAHTTDPKRAKPWVDPYGVSGLYKLGECYKAKDGTVKRCLVEQTEYDAEDMPSYWETVDEA